MAEGGLIPYLVVLLVALSYSGNMFIQDGCLLNGCLSKQGLISVLTLHLLFLLITVWKHSQPSSMFPKSPKEGAITSSGQWCSFSLKA